MPTNFHHVNRDRTLTAVNERLLIVLGTEKRLKHLSYIEDLEKLQ